MNQRIINKNNIYLHPRYEENVTCTNDGSETLLEQFLNSVNKYKNKNFLGTIICNIILYN
ncbi:long chain fatty acid ligase [Vairimorpha apis BRL 01]|uniref:Long chain fatty acid ligase n=1 Tax=Vairimorpha apis BRL 01 TaxID=1037528 RepID=T0LBE3_9MICR|nr:long chain fatty acid ligase [Vairimorpha apis BRL 01]